MRHPLDKTPKAENQIVVLDKICINNNEYIYI